MLYLPGQPPYYDTHAQTSFGLPANYGIESTINTTCATRWAKVIQEWSDRYGDKVSGWWFDGCYRWAYPDDATFKKYADALKHGNPNSICAFNPGTEEGPKNYTPYEDFVAGECEDPGLTPTSRWWGDSQWHILYYLGGFWSQTDVARPSSYWIDWIKTCSAKQGVLTLDVGKDVNRKGTICANHYKQLKEIKAAIRPATSVEPRTVKSVHSQNVADTRQVYSIDGRAVSQKSKNSLIKNTISILMDKNGNSKVRFE